MLVRTILAMALSLVFISTAAKADRIAASEAVVSAMVDSAQAILQDTNLDADGKRVGLKDVLNTYFDVAGITRATAGQYWRKATPEQQDQYSLLFTEVLTNMATGQLDWLVDLEFVPTKTTEKGPKMVLVGGRIVDNSGVEPDAIVNWRVATREGQKPAIIDIEVENISLLITQRQENQAIIRKNGGDFNALIASLEAQIESFQ